MLKDSVSARFPQDRRHFRSNKKEVQILLELLCERLDVESGRIIGKLDRILGVALTISALVWDQ